MKIRAIPGLLALGLCLACSFVRADAEVGSWLRIHALTTECRVQVLGSAKIVSDGFATLFGNYRFKSRGVSQTELSRNIEAVLPDELRQRIKSVHVQLFRNRDALERGDPEGPLVIPACPPPREDRLHRDSYNRRSAFAWPSDRRLQPTSDLSIDLTLASGSSA